MKYYKVIAKCGHVSKGFFIDKEFPICAKTGSEASQLVMKYPRVKKHLKYCISSCNEISQEEYLILKKKNNNDGYFKAKNKRDLYDFCPDIDSKKKRLDLISTKTKKINYEYRNAKEAQFIREIKRFLRNSIYSNALRINI